MTADELRAKAHELTPAGCAMSAAVLRLFADCAAEDAALWSFYRRIVAQCEILAGRAERSADSAIMVKQLRERLAAQSEVMKRLVESKYGIEVPT